jgi:methylglutamate dehydrogenase subunit D
VVDCTIVESDRHGLGLILPRRGIDAAMLGQALGLPLVDIPRAVRAPDMTVMGVAPGQWLAHGPDAPAGWVEGLAARLGPLATVIDQSSGHVLYTLSGADAGRLLQKGLAIDLAALPPDAVTVGAIGGSGVIVEGAHLFVARSHARAVRGWLDHALAAMAW